MRLPLLGANLLKSHDRKLETEFFSGAHDVRARLNSVSPSFCLAKWLQTTLHLTTGRTHSCFHPPSHPVPPSELRESFHALHNTKEKQEERAQMLRGKRPKGCSYCWNIEDQPSSPLSDRHYRSAEPWALPHFSEVLKSGLGAEILPRYLEVNFNNACQLKCSYCNPQFSSSWQQEVKVRGAYALVQGAHNSPSYFEQNGLVADNSKTNPHAQAFWEWWPKVFPELRVFRMTGGEPLLDPNTLRVLDYILENPNPELRIAVTSNFAIEGPRMETFIAKARELSLGRFVKQLQLFVSLDSTGKRAEYIRHGLDFQLLDKNVNQFLTEVPNASVTFILTLNNLSITSIRETLMYFLQLRKKHSHLNQRVFFDTPLLRYPDWQSVQLLPSSFREPVKEAIQWMTEHLASFEDRASRFHRFLDFEVARMKRNLEWMSQDQNERWLSEHRANFFRFFSEHDLRRQTDFLVAFPEMEEFWRLCQRESDRYWELSAGGFR